MNYMRIWEGWVGRRWRKFYLVEKFIRSSCVYLVETKIIEWRILGVFWFEFGKEKSRDFIEGFWMGFGKMRGFVLEIGF